MSRLYVNKAHMISINNALSEQLGAAGLCGHMGVFMHAACVYANADSLAGFAAEQLALHGNCPPGMLSGMLGANPHFWIPTHAW